MESNGCGDAPAPDITMNLEKKENDNQIESIENPTESSNEKPQEISEITPQAIEEQETKLKDRIAHCRTVIETLKLELNEEKSKLKTAKQQPCSYHAAEECDTSSLRNSFEVTTSDKYDICFPTSMYSACVESKLARDDNLLEYEKQLEQYQITLNMAQITKKQAIRRQMLAKAFRLKLLEVENQCNIELLRVKQSLQCLEPLQLIADNWKMDKEDTHDPSTFQLQQYPESWPKLGALSCTSTSGITPRDEKPEEDQNAPNAANAVISE